MSLSLAPAYRYDTSASRGDVCSEQLPPGFIRVRIPFEDDDDDEKREKNDARARVNMSREAFRQGFAKVFAIMAGSEITPGLFPGSDLERRVLIAAEQLGVAAAGRLPLCLTELDAMIEEGSETPVKRVATSNLRSFAEGVPRDAISALERWVTRPGHLRIKVEKEKRVENGDEEDAHYGIITGVAGGGLLASACGWDVTSGYVGWKYAEALHDARASSRDITCDALTWRARRDTGSGFSLLWSLLTSLDAYRADLVGRSGYVLLLNLGDDETVIEFLGQGRHALAPDQLLLLPGDAAYRAAGGGVRLLRGLLVPVSYELFAHAGTTDVGAAASADRNRELPPLRV